MLTKDQRKALADEIIADPKSFNLTLDTNGRRWFVDQVIQRLQNAPTSVTDGAIPARVKTIVAKVKEIVGSPTDQGPPKADIPLTGISVEAESDQWLADSYTRRVEIIYGTIAVDPTLVEQPANKKFLDLMIRRRFRTLARMELWVNGDVTPLRFQYPTPGCDYRINEAAVPLWNQATPHKLPFGFTLPRFTIKLPSSSLVPAVQQLWEKPAAPCQGNVLDCATAMSVVLMDSLLEAKNPDGLLRTLNARGPLFLSICNPTRPDAGPTFVLDQAPDRVFTTDYGSMEDLQVGDYVYVWNHSLYELFDPIGPWRGEHAIISACGDRDPLTGFKVTGHGVRPATIAALRTHLMADLQSALSMLYVVGVNFLAFLEAGLSSPGVTDQQAQVIVDGTPVAGSFYLFSQPLTFTDFTGDKVNLNAQLLSHVIVYLPTLKRFGFHRSSVTLAKAIAEPFDSVWVQQRAFVPTSSQYDPVNWVVPYAGGNWELFQKVNGRVTINQLGNADMPNPPVANEAGRVKIVGPTKRPTTNGAF